MDPATKAALIAYLSGFATPERVRQMDQVLDRRTRYLTVVLEDVNKPHNASAVMRSCECFGIQDMHVIEQQASYRPIRDVAMGSSNWVDLHRHRDQADPLACLDQLRGAGYRVAAFTLRPGAIPIGQLPIDAPLALLFGSELEGLTQAAHEGADLFVSIPTFGFTQSLNISVTVALGLYELTNRLGASDIAWRLDEEARMDLKLAWLTHSIRAGGKLKARFLRARAADQKRGSQQSD